MQLCAKIGLDQNIRKILKSSLNAVDPYQITKKAIKIQSDSLTIVKEIFDLLILGTVGHP